MEVNRNGLPSRCLQMTKHLHTDWEGPAQKGTKDKAGRGDITVEEHDSMWGHLQRDTMTLEMLDVEGYLHSTFPAVCVFLFTNGETESQGTEACPRYQDTDSFLGWPSPFPSVLTFRFLPWGFQSWPLLCTPTLTGKSSAVHQGDLRLTLCLPPLLICETDSKPLNFSGVAFPAYNVEDFSPSTCQSVEMNDYEGLSTMWVMQDVSE